jgi:hypothetical protein
MAHQQGWGMVKTEKVGGSVQRTELEEIRDRLECHIFPGQAAGCTCVGDLRRLGRVRYAGAHQEVRRPMLVPAGHGKIGGGKEERGRKVQWEDTRVWKKPSRRSQVYSRPLASSAICILNMRICAPIQWKGLCMFCIILHHADMLYTGF